VATSEGLVVGDLRPLQRLQVTCIAEDASTGNRQWEPSGGGRTEYEFFLEQERFARFARKRPGRRS